MQKLMKSLKLFPVLAVALAAFAYSGNIMAKDSDSTKTNKMTMHHKNMSMHEHMNMESDKGGKNVLASNDNEQTIVHKGVIDLKAIDKNKDGKVYQDQMDWNVISDKSGKCPLCKMTLEEVTVKKAKENLKNNGFKVKE